MTAAPKSVFTTRYEASRVTWVIEERCGYPEGNKKRDKEIEKLTPYISQTPSGGQKVCELMGGALSACDSHPYINAIDRLAH